MGANDHSDGNSAALSKYMLLCDAAIRASEAQEIDTDDDALMKYLCGERLAEPIKRLMVLRQILSTVPDDQLRFSLKAKLDALHLGLLEVRDDM